MALNTLGSNANNTLSALQGHPDRLVAANQANIAALQALISDDKTGLVTPSAWGQGPDGGLLYIPRRGVLKVLMGDWIGVDASGWPILLSANAIAATAINGNATSWTHN